MRRLEYGHHSEFPKTPSDLVGLHGIYTIAANTRFSGPSSRSQRGIKGDMTTNLTHGVQRQDPQNPRYMSLHQPDRLQMRVACLSGTCC